MSDKKTEDDLAEAKRIMGTLARTPHKSHVKQSETSKAKRSKRKTGKVSKE